MKFKVIDPKGVSIGGAFHKESDIVEGDPKAAAISTPLHFKQIEAAEAAKPDKDPEIEVSDAARKLAEEKNIDLATVKGTGKDGAITKPDVEAAAEAAK